MHRISPVSSSGILRKKNALAPNTMFGVRTQSARFHPNFNFIRIRLTRRICATGGITSVRHGRSQHTRRSLSIGSPGDLFRKIKYMRFFSPCQDFFEKFRKFPPVGAKNPAARQQNGARRQKLLREDSPRLSVMTRLTKHRGDASLSKGIPEMQFKAFRSTGELSLSPPPHRVRMR